MQLREFFMNFVKLPKIELHAHLNGSLTDNIITKLLIANDNTSLFEEYKKFDKSINQIGDFFQLFGFIYKLGSKPEYITLMTKLVIEQFQKDGCVYLELRSTPKNTENMNKKQYIEALIEGIKQAHGNIIVRLIISLDRRHSEAQSLDTLQVVQELNSEYIVGVDLCGDPTVGNFEQMLHLFEFARNKLKLKITLHLGEVPDRDEDNLKMLQFIPDRIAHCTFLDKINEQFIIDYQIPIEMCLTSNISCCTVSSIEEHHFRYFYGKVNLILCTDDWGIFGSSVSDEYRIVAENFGIENTRMFELAKSAVSCIFAGDDVKKRLFEIFDEYAESFGTGFIYG